MPQMGSINQAAMAQARIAALKAKPAGASMPTSADAVKAQIAALKTPKGPVVPKPVAKPAVQITLSAVQIAAVKAGVTKIALSVEQTDAIHSQQGNPTSMSRGPDGWPRVQ